MFNNRAIPPNLAMRLFDGISSPKMYVITDGLNHRVSGLVSLSHGQVITKAMASCHFVVTPAWLEDIPRVRCDEAWRSPGDPEWHIDNAGFLCAELGLRWADEVKKTYNIMGACAAADFAAHWLINSTATLLYRQRLRFQGVISRWQNQWNYWPHWKAGADEYRLRQERGAGFSP